MNKRVVTTIFGGVLVALSLCATAQTFQVPHTFTGGTPALANQVNENFDAIEARLPNTARVFIPPKAISSGLGPTVQVVLMDPVNNPQFTAAFGRPSDYVPGTAPDITIRLLFSGCGATNVDITVVSTFFDIGANADNTVTEPNVIVPMPAETSPITIEAPTFTRTGLGDVNYITMTRNGGVNDTCPGNLSLHGIVITYPR